MRRNVRGFGDGVAGGLTLGLHDNCTSEIRRAHCQRMLTTTDGSEDRASR
jgi:hypothetical protein